MLRQQGEAKSPEPKTPAFNKAVARKQRKRAVIKRGALLAAGNPEERINLNGRRDEILWQVQEG